jgi:hypothetical protein
MPARAVQGASERFREEEVALGMAPEEAAGVEDEDH